MSGHIFHRHCSYMVIPSLKRPNFLNGKCNQFGEVIQFVLKKCTSILLGSFKGPRINNSFTVLTYHYAFGPEDEHVENLILDQLGSQP
jgi:hypothetical protein